MKQLLSILTLILASTAAAVAGEDTQPKAVAQSFYDGYMKVLAENGDTVKYVSSSALVTPELKKAYKAFMKRPESDPIICGQDYPDAGFAAGKQTIDGEEAKVQMKSRDAAFDHTIDVSLRNVDGAWLISGTGDLSE